MIYTLQIFDYDSFAYDILEGPEVPNWNAYCESLLDEAVTRYFEDEKFRESNYMHLDSWITSYTIYESLRAILAEKGYKKYNPPNFDFNGDRIIETDEEPVVPLSESLKNRIIEHNKKIRKKVYKEIEGFDD